MQVYVEGRLSHSVYQDNAGETKISLEVNARDVQIVQDPQQQQANPSQQQQPNPVQQPSTEPSTEDDPDKLPW